MRKLLATAGAALVVGGAGGFFAGWEVREAQLLKAVPDALAVKAIIDSGQTVERVMAEREAEWDAAMPDMLRTATEAADAAEREAADASR